MVGVKRKVLSSLASRNGSIKKQKQEQKAFPKTKTPARNLETETDSDPIVESDTTEHSGDDDGVSWPSDDNAGDDWAPEELGEEKVEQPDRTIASSDRSKETTTPNIGSSSK